MVLKSCCEVDSPMLIVCPSCAASYDVTPARLQSSGRVSCTRCGDRCRAEQALLAPAGIDVDYGAGGTHRQALAGLPVNRCGPAFDGVATGTEDRNGAPVLVVQGNIADHAAIRSIHHRGIAAEVR
jgi:predicted Zn finger-like uncharacterized protein